MKEHKKGYYTFLMINGSVPFELRNIESAANERIKKIIKQLADEENVNEELKATDQMEWVRCMNNIKNRAEEILPLLFKLIEIAPTLIKLFCGHL